MKRKTVENFIKEAKAVHGDKYDYSKVNYINARTKVCIICPIHGEFWQIPNDHIRGVGCPKCKNEFLKNIKRLTTSQFIEKAKEIHGDKYDYSKANYIDSKTKICIICPIHGEFWQIPNVHINGHGCPKCSHRYAYTTEEFIEKAKEIHGDKYDYSKVEYVNNKTKVCIICPIHGEFWQKPDAHLQGQGCNLCQKPVHDTNSFVAEAKKVHGDKYDYSKVEYINNKIRVCIVCPKHGEFWQRPSTHISQKCGCPICKQSHLESETRDFLLKNNIQFVQQQMFNWLGLMRLDFYLPQYNVAIECQGIQHFEPIEFWGGQKAYKGLIKRDKIKKELCEIHNIRVVYVNYDNKVDKELNFLIV